jgi:hypothetical protein
MMLLTVSDRLASFSRKPSMLTFKAVDADLNCSTCNRKGRHNKHFLMSYEVGGLVMSY